MRKKRILLGVIGAAVVVLVGLVVGGAFREREPEYGGKRLSEWVAPYGEQNAPQSYLSPVRPYHLSALDGEALRAIRHIGPQALPYLLNWINLRGWDGRKNVLAYGAVGGFSGLGAHGVPAIARLRTMLYETNFPLGAERVAHALAFIGKDALPVLLEALTNQNCFSVRIEAIHSIATMGTNALSALPILRHALDDPYVRADVSYTLGILKLEPALTIPGLMAMLQDTNSHVRMMVVMALRMFGYEARMAAPSLQKLLDDSDSSVRILATNALRQITRETVE